MAGWPLVQYSQARQVGQAMGLKGPKLPEPGVLPEQHFRDLMEADRQPDAIAFLAHALPRYEMIVWVGRSLDAIRSGAGREPEDLRAIEVAKRWIRDPADDVRREARAMAEAMEETSPEQLLLNAIFLSGGSIAPEDLPPVHAPESSAAHIGGAAIQLAAYRTPSPVSALATALQIGENLAKNAG